MGERQGKKLQAYNTNGGLLFPKRDRCGVGKSRTFMAQAWKKAALDGAAFGVADSMGLYGTVTVSCVLWTVEPETAVMVKV